MKLILCLALFLSSSLYAEVTISSFATSISEQSDEVKHNVRLAARKLNNTLIRSDEVFSFSGVVGEADIKNGFKSGNVLYQDYVVKEPGGGLCQVSSTLYNALLSAGFIVIERHRHFQPVTYVPLGLDATIKYGKKDLRMKNSCAQTVRISAETTDNLLIIKICAERPNLHRYSVSTEECELQIPLQDGEGYDDIRPAIEVEVYRSIISGDKETEKALLYKDFYPPVRRSR